MLLRANERNGMITIISRVGVAADSSGLVAMECLLLCSGWSSSAINKETRKRSSSLHSPPTSRGSLKTLTKRRGFLNSLTQRGGRRAPVLG